VTSWRDRGADRRGFTLLELLIALLMGVIVLASATSVATSTFRNQDGMRTRENVVRQARFVGMSLDRDLSEAGVELESDISFGSVAVRNDTLSILSVAYDPDRAPVYRMVPQDDAGVLLPPGGSCGYYCVNLRGGTTGAEVEIEPGDIALLNAGGARRLIVARAVQPIPDSTAVTFFDGDSYLLRPANYAGGLRLPSGGTSVQKLRAVTYWMERGMLMRAERFGEDGKLAGVPVAEGVDSFTVSLVFNDGSEASEANPTDGNSDNDYDDIVSVRLRLRLMPDSSNSGAARGEQPSGRSFDWRFSPRNLIYERNRTR